MKAGKQHVVRHVMLWPQPNAGRLEAAFQGGERAVEDVPPDALCLVSISLEHETIVVHARRSIALGDWLAALLTKWRQVPPHAGLSPPADEVPFNDPRTRGRR